MTITYREPYSIIYADPPWSYRVSALQGCAESYYEVLSDDALAMLPVNEIAADNSVLFLWVTFPKLKEGLDVMQSWGFEYKTNAFNYIKFNKNKDTLYTGMGFYTRSNGEICLLGVRGKGLERVSKAVHSVIFGRKEPHSKKPDEARDRIVQLFGDLPRVELFAREKTLGWDSTGLECDGLDIYDFLDRKMYDLLDFKAE